MTLKTPEERISRSSELLEALDKAVRELRQQAQDLSAQLKSGEDVDLGNGKSQVAAVDGLLRTCLKVEANLVEQQQRQAGIVQGGYALDLVQARFEIGCRLARLRRCCDEGKISG